MSSSIPNSFGTEEYDKSGISNQGEYNWLSMSNNTLSLSCVVIPSPPKNCGNVDGLSWELSSVSTSRFLSNSCICVTGVSAGVFEFIFGTKLLNVSINEF